MAARQRGHVLSRAASISHLLGQAQLRPAVASMPDRVYLADIAARTLLRLLVAYSAKVTPPTKCGYKNFGTQAWSPTPRVPGVLRTASSTTLGEGEAGEIGS